jgi:hypothetical protein
MYPSEEGRLLAMRLIPSFLACAAALVACGGSTSTLGSGSQGSSSVSGTAGGQPVTTVDEVGLSGTEVQNGITVAYAGAAITNVPGTCAVLERHGDPPSATVLLVAVGVEGSTVPPGTYVVGAQSTQTAQATYFSQDAACKQTLNLNATSGTVTLTAASGAFVEGSFDLHFANGDHLSGTFSAPMCDVNPFTNNTGGACGS